MCLSSACFISRVLNAHTRNIKVEHASCEINVRVCVRVFACVCVRVCARVVFGIDGTGVVA